MKLSGQRNQCQGCKQYFNSNTSFEVHRTGKHGVDRRCMTPDEMKAKGMLINKAGFWITEESHYRGKDHEGNETQEDSAGGETQGSAA